MRKIRSDKDIDALVEVWGVIQKCIALEYLASCTMHTMRCNQNCTPRNHTQATSDTYTVCIVGGVVVV